MSSTHAACFGTEEQASMLALSCIWESTFKPCVDTSLRGRSTADGARANAE